MEKTVNNSNESIISLDVKKFYTMVLLKKAIETALKSIEVY